MENITELNNKVNNTISKDELKIAILTAMDKATTIEELLILRWHFGKTFYAKFSIDKNTLFFENLERISYNNVISNCSLIIEDLINGVSLEQIRDKYNVTREGVKRVAITYFENGNYDERIIDAIIKDDAFTDSSRDRDFLLAKVAFKMFIDDNCNCFKMIHDKFCCPLNIIANYLDILETNKHPLYKQYMELHDERLSKKNSNIGREIMKNKSEEEKNKRNYIATLDSDEILEILSNSFNVKCKS